MEVFEDEVIFNDPSLGHVVAPIIQSFTVSFLLKNARNLFTPVH